MDIGMILILALVFGFHLTLLALGVVVFREFGRVVNQRILRSRGRFRLRTLLLVATVIQGAVALAAWQTQGRVFSVADFLVFFVADFLFLGFTIWILWYCLEEMLQLLGWQRPVHRKPPADIDVDIPLTPDDGRPIRRKRWWAKEWPNRYRPMRPGQIYRIPTGRDKF